MITKDNIITLSYKGLIGLIYLIFGKKDKILSLFLEEDYFDGLSITTEERTKKAKNGVLDNLEKITFSYKYKLPNGKIKTNRFDAYNLEQVKTYLVKFRHKMINLKFGQKMKTAIF